MILHLIYKEWLKTRWFALIALVAGVAAVVGILAGVASGVRADAPFFFYQVIVGKVRFFDLFRFVPLLAAVLIGCSQFLPEVTDKRIKLSLHLPMPPTVVIYSMVLYGFVLLTLLVGICLALFAGLGAVWLPGEILVPALKTMLVWVLGGMTAYFWIAMMAFEPVGRYRFGYFVVAGMLVSIFMRRYPIGGVDVLLEIFAGLTLVSSFSVLFTAYRFNKGIL
ncbi:hypothetical protein [Alistipes sp.]|uniref:hypothetical protein n=1 Tax=Alistipes sp. TaxID=1872444 RepID=UPI003A84277D